MSAAIAALAASGVLVVWPAPPLHRLRAVDHGLASVRAAHQLAVLALVQLAAFLLGAPLLTAVAALAVVVGGSALRRRHDRGLRAGRQAAAVDVVFALASELRAGRTPAQALACAADTNHLLRTPLAVAARVVRSGASASEPLRRVAELPGCEVLAAVGAVWEVTEQAGGAVADVLDRLGAGLDADAADRRAFEAALAGPRASMTLLAGLPALGLLVGQSAGAHPLHLLLHRPLGWALLAGAGALEGAGLAWSRRLVRAVLPA
jgi:tight adherence protein B